MEQIHETVVEDTEFASELKADFFSSSHHVTELM